MQVCVEGAFKHQLPHSHSNTNCHSLQVCVEGTLSVLQPPPASPSGGHTRSLLVGSNATRSFKGTAAASTRTSKKGAFVAPDLALSSFGDYVGELALLAPSRRLAATVVAGTGRGKRVAQPRRRRSTSCVIHHEAILEKTALEMAGSTGSAAAAPAPAAACVPLARPSADAARRRLLLRRRGSGGGSGDNVYNGGSAAPPLLAVAPPLLNSAASSALTIRCLGCNAPLSRPVCSAIRAHLASPLMNG